MKRERNIFFNRGMICGFWGWILCGWKYLEIVIYNRAILALFPPFLKFWAQGPGISLEFYGTRELERLFPVAE